MKRSFTDRLFVAWKSFWADEAIVIARRGKKRTLVYAKAAYNGAVSDCQLHLSMKIIGQREAVENMNKEMDAVVAHAQALLGSPSTDKQD